MSNPTSFSIRSDVQTSDTNVNGNLQVQGNQTLQGSLTQGGVSHRQAVGYSNTDTFLTIAVTNLNTVAGQTAAAGTALQLPTGAYLKQVSVIAITACTSAAAGATLDLGTGVASATTSAGFFDGMDVDNTGITGLGATGNYLINTQPTNSSTFVTEPAEVGATGSPEKLIAAGAGFVTADITSEALTGGAIKVIIDYILI